MSSALWAGVHRQAELNEGPDQLLQLVSGVRQGEQRAGRMDGRASLGRFYARDHREMSGNKPSMLRRGKGFFMMSLRQRILSVYRGETPDVVPYMLDLSHWFYHRYHLPWDISRSYDKPETALIDYHKNKGVGFYVPNLGSFFAVKNRPDVNVETIKESEQRIVWRYETPLGRIERSRAWNENTYSWHIDHWGVKTEQDLRVLGYALSGRTFEPLPGRYEAWRDYVGDIGVLYGLPGYSAMGYLLNYWMGIESTMYAVHDWPETVRSVVDQINENNLDLIDMMARAPVEVIIMGDNFSSNVQPPSFYDVWSRAFYEEAIRRLHAAGKYVAVHIDGNLRGALRMIRDSGADCADAVTPAPMGDLTPEQCLAETGAGMIMSGGVPPNVWLPEVPVADFRTAVTRWLELRNKGGRIIAAAGDQVPPRAAEDRIEIMRDLVEKHGRRGASC
jgi:hypothetical protein